MVVVLITFLLDMVCLSVWRLKFLFILGCVYVCVCTRARMCVLGVAIVRKVRGFCFSHNNGSGDKQFDRWCGFTRMSSRKEPAFFLCCLHYICSLPCVCVWASPPGSKMVALFITSGVEKKKVKCKGAKLSPTPLFVLNRKNIVITMIKNIKNTYWSSFISSFHPRARESG